MAESDHAETSILSIVEDMHEDSDDKSNSLDRTQSFTRLESDIKEHLSSIAAQVKGSILGLNDHVQPKFEEYDAEMQSIEAFVKKTE